MRSSSLDWSRPVFLGDYPARPRHARCRPGGAVSAHRESMSGKKAKSQTAKDAAQVARDGVTLAKVSQAASKLGDVEVLVYPIAGIFRDIHVPKLAGLTNSGLNAGFTCWEPYDRVEGRSTCAACWSYDFAKLRR